MTTTLPPHTPGLSRTIPADPTPDVVSRIRRLIDGGDIWVLRPCWARYLRLGDERDAVAIDRLTQDQAIAVHAWLRQQQHHLHRILEGERVAPDGWIQARPLYSAVAKRAHLDF